MLVEDWMGIPVVIMVIILGRSKVRAIVEARERHRQSLKEKLYEEDKGDDEGMSQMDREKDRIEQNTPDYAGKQKELEKLVENLIDKVQKLETPCYIFRTKSVQFIRQFNNLLSSTGGFGPGEVQWNGTSAKQRIDL